MQYILVVILLALSWLQPFHVLPWVSWHSEILVFFGIFLFAWMVLISNWRLAGSGKIDLPWLVFPLFLLALVAAVQGMSETISFQGDALVFVLYMASYAMCLTLGFAFSAQRPASEASLFDRVNAGQALSAMAFAFVLGAFASSIAAFVQVFDLWTHLDLINRMSQLRRPGGNMGQPNHLATLLLMGMVSLLFLYESKKIMALPSVLILFVFCMALALTESRTGVLSFLVLSIWWFAKNKKINFNISRWVVVASGTGYLCFLWIWPSIFSFIQQNFDTSAQVDTKGGMRLVVWPQLLEAVSLHPWLGWGLGQVPKAHNAVLHAYPLSDPFSYSHNVLLDLALGVGVPLAALLVFGLAIWLWRRIKTANQLPAWYCIAVALPVAMHSMLEFPFAYAYFVAPVMFAFGVLEGLAGGKPAFAIRVRSVIPVLLVLSGVALWSVVEYVEIEEDFRIARFEALRVGQTPAGYEKPDVVLLTQLGALLEGARIVPKPGMSMEELKFAQKVALRYPWPATQNRYALSLALNGNSEEALRQLHVMQVMHGEKAYAGIKRSWHTLAQEKYPELNQLKLP